MSYFVEGSASVPDLAFSNIRDIFNISVLLALSQLISRKHTDLRNPPFRRPSNDDMKIHKKTEEKRSKKKKVVEEEACDHAVVILGIDTTSLDENEHFAWVKSTYSVKWGLDGVTRVWLGYFKYILLLTYNHQDVVDLIAKEREKQKSQSEGRGSATRSMIPEQDHVDSQNEPYQFIIILG